MTTELTSPELLAVITVNGVAGSWERGTKPAEELARKCARRVRIDFQKVFNIPHDHVFSVAVYDVTGIDKVSMGPDGTKDLATGQTLPLREIIRTT
jgi:hypothetical protein